MLAPNPFFDKGAAKRLLAAKKIEIMILHEDSFLQCMHEAAAERLSPSFTCISFRYPKSCCFNFVEPM